MSTGRLAGRRIVVTRPAGQNEGLAALIRAAGGEPVVFPVLEILDLEDTRVLVAAIDRLDEYDLAVFISPNAVDKAMNVVRARREWPQRLRAATIGRASEKALARHGVADVIAPTGRFDSEALLELPALAGVRGWRVVIFRGDGGRELLGDTLRARGATVDYVECYARARPNVDVGPLLKRWGRGEIDAVTVSSSEGLRNLYDMLGKLGQAWLKRTPLFAPHARIAENARALGCERVIETGPADDGLFAGLSAFWDNSRQ
ncbi:MAG TPA: uroporphyrinogen-III synthase [Burkholderiales bacterium]|nr:uroporphyrinogen-III synthase [Burkholderiales bacterium]